MQFGLRNVVARNIVRLARSSVEPSGLLLSVILFTGAVYAQVPAAPALDQVNGSLIISVADYFTEHRSETKYFIKVATGDNYELSFDTEVPDNLKTGMSVTGRGRIKGRQLQNAEIVGAVRRDSCRPGCAPQKVPSLPSITPHSGVQKTLVYVLQSATSPSSFTNRQLYNDMFAQSGLSVDTFYQQNSFGSVSFEGDVIGPYTISVPATCDISNMQSQGDQAAMAAGIDISTYGHHVYMLPNEMFTMNICTFGGWSDIGGNPGVSWINSAGFSPSRIGISSSAIYVILAHELGHQLSMMHAQSIQADGSLVEYGDNSCPMGDEDYLVVNFHPLHRIQEGWIPLSNIRQVTESGIYQVNFAETQTNAIQAIQIVPPGRSEPLYISYRQPTGLDANLYSPFIGGATIQYWLGGVNKTQLATNYPWNGALSDGQIFTSPNGLVSIKQITHNSLNVTLDITIRRLPPTR